MGEIKQMPYSARTGNFYTVWGDAMKDIKYPTEIKACFMRRILKLMLNRDKAKKSQKKGVSC